jgi:hypothetical protein
MPQITAAGPARIVRDPYSWTQNYMSTRSPQPRAQIHILVIEKVALVESLE